ncbi:hypothetical protein FF1_028078 [Malus domestica]
MALRVLVARKALRSRFQSEPRTLAHFCGLQTFSLPNLPYDYDALELAISGEIMELHHKKHHVPHHNHNYYSHHPVMKNLLLRRRLFFCIPDTWLLPIEDGFLWMVAMLQSLRSGQNVGCKIFWALLLVYIAVFIAVSCSSSEAAAPKRC